MRADVARGHDPLEREPPCLEESQRLAAYTDWYLNDSWSLTR